MNIFDYLHISYWIDQHGFTLVDIKELSFIDNNTEYTTYQIEVEENIEDYSLTLAIEKDIKSRLCLFDTNIHLEIL